MMIDELTTLENSKAHREERIRRIREAEIEGLNLVYLCKNHDWYVGRSEESRKLHYALRECEALPTSMKEALELLQLSERLSK
jgi:hypothetical protein